MNYSKIVFVVGRQHADWAAFRNAMLNIASLKDQIVDYTHRDDFTVRDDAGELVSYRWISPVTMNRMRGLEAPSFEIERIGHWIESWQFQARAELEHTLEALKVRARAAAERARKKSAAAEARRKREVRAQQENRPDGDRARARRPRPRPARP